MDRPDAVACTVDEMADPAHGDPTSRLATVVIFTTVTSCSILAMLLLMLVRQSGWSRGSIYQGLLAAGFLANVLCLLIWNPVVLARRMVLHRGTKAWDRIWMLVFLAVLVSVVLVAVQDLNGRKLGPPPGIPWLFGLTTFSLGWVLWIWAMVANPYFEKMVRIQIDHGHRVIDRGPYAYIRHPGYVGLSAVLLSTPLLLASTETFLPILIAIVLLVIRTALEDRTLQAELPGYLEYAATVRHRMIPGVW